MIFFTQFGSVVEWDYCTIFRFKVKNSSLSRTADIMDKQGFDSHIENDNSNVKIFLNPL